MTIPNIDGLIRTAIGQRQIVRLSYQGRVRVLEPHDYGIQKGRRRLLGFQIGGSSSGKLPNWRWFDVDGISSLELSDQHFKGGRSAPSQKHHDWDELFIRVKPSEQPG